MHINASIQIKGDFEPLCELEGDLNKNGVKADLARLQTFGADGGGFDFLKVIGPWGAIAAVLVTYVKLRYQTRKVLIERDGTKISVEGKSPKEVSEMLQSADSICVKKLNRRKK
jgi:hypothetical protein